MPEILVISGKGGTGKTSITASLAHLAQDVLICDLDVDAPDLHLILEPELEHSEEFTSGNEAVIDTDKCSGCGTCQSMCRYGALSQNDDGTFSVDPLQCEGCKVCVEFCPEKAIQFPPRHCGNWYISRTRMGSLVHAQLFPGQENSGRLVALLRQKAKEISEQQQGSGLILSDGPPGIGCPVISSLSGIDYAVLVTEPTPSGHHDLERVLELCGHFKVPGGVIINKYDLNHANSGKIEAMAKTMGFDLLARLPFSKAFTEAMLQAKAVTELGPSELTRNLEMAWKEILGRVGAQAAA